MFKLFVLIISTVLTAVAARAQSDISNTTCSPFRLLVIWHTSNGEDHAFIDQKRLIIQLLLDIPQGTEIHVTAINTQLYHLLHFKKDKTKNWIYNISMYNPAILENHTINGSLINETLFTFRKQNDKKEVAELTILVVSEKTLTENSLETIKNIKRCVVFTGLNPPPRFWTSLATDSQHVVMLNMTSESIGANINCAADTVLDLLCEDSRLICDSDEFWTGKRCVSCSYICSADTKKLQDICLDLCPYYSQLSLENTDADKNATVKSGNDADKKVTVESGDEADKNVTGKSGDEADKNVTGESDKTNNDLILQSFSLLLLVLVLLSVVAVLCVRLRRVWMRKQHPTAYLRRKCPNQETSRAHDKPELRAQQEILHLNSLKGN